MAIINYSDLFDRLQEYIDSKIMDVERFLNSEEIKIVAHNIESIVTDADSIDNINLNASNMNHIRTNAENIGFIKTAYPSAEAAKLSAEFAHQWAVNPEDNIVDDGNNPPDYSAYHWAMKAQQAIDGLEWGNIGGEIDNQTDLFDTFLKRDGDTTDGNFTFGLLKSTKGLQCFSSNIFLKQITIGNEDSYQTNPSISNSFGKFQIKVVSDDGSHEYYNFDKDGTITLANSNAKFWSELNMGSGSGLDADKLDGKEASDFAPASSATDEIRLYTGDTSNLKQGWYVCDGNNGTVDLSDKFIDANGTQVIYIQYKGA